MKSQKISLSRMFRHLLDSGVSALFLLNLPINFVVLIFIWPLGVMLIILQFAYIVAFFPIMLFIKLPLSVWLYRKNTDSFLPWMGYFFAISFIYVLLLSVLLATPATSFASLVIFGTLNGFFMWKSLYGKKIDMLFMR